MRIALKNGVWVDTISLMLGGAGGLASATATTFWPQALGFTGLAAGILLFAWGVEINGRHMWQPWWRPIDIVRKGIVSIGMDDALRYLARESAWSRMQDDQDPRFASRVAAEITSALASGDLRARGRYFHVLKGGVKDPPLYPRLDIEPKFWQTTHINAWWALNDSPQCLGGQLAQNGVPPYGESYEGLHDVRVDSKRLRQIWPSSGR